jgi:hypothetical protein
MSASDGFSWNGDRVAIVIPEQWAIAVYKNSDGDVVIRQGQFPEEDDWIVVAALHAPALARVILGTARYGDVEFVRRCGGASEDVAELGPEMLNAELPENAIAVASPSPGALRQKRYRERHRYTAGVTPDRNGRGSAEAALPLGDGEAGDGAET